MNNATANELVTVGATTTELDAEANLTFDGTDFLIGGAGKIQLRDTGLYVASNADGDLDVVSDGTAVDSINLESAGGITLDAGTAASGIIYEDDGTEMLRIHNSSSDVIVEAKVQDKDIIFKGDAPSNAVEGAFICIEINFNGSHSIGWNTVFEFAASTEASETAADGKTDIHVFRYNGAVWQEVGRTLNLSES